MAGQNRNKFRCDLSGFRINDVTAGGKRHALDAQIAIFAPLSGKPNTGGSSAADKLDRSFGRQHVQTITYDCLSAETSRVLERFGELGHRVDLATQGFVVKQAYDHIAFAHALSIMFCTDLRTDQPLVHRVEFDPSAVDLVDELCRQRRAIAQFDLEATLG